MGRAQEQAGVGEVALVVDDDATMAANLASALESLGINAGCVTSLHEARRYLTEEYGPVDYIFLDLELPDGDGLEILPFFSRMSKRPLLAVLDSHLNAPQVLGFFGECVMFVPKSMGVTDLVNLVDLLRERRPRKPSDACSRFAKLHRLSPRERQLLSLALDGANNDEAAGVLGCTRATVSTYWNRIFHKTGVGCQRDVVTAMLRQTLKWQGPSWQWSVADLLYLRSRIAQYRRVDLTS